MYIFDNQSYLTSEEVNRRLDETTEITEEEREFIRKLRETESRPFEKFAAVDGLSLVYQVNGSQGDGVSTEPLIYFGGVVFQASYCDVRDNKTVRLFPLYQSNPDARKDYVVSKFFWDNPPKKIGKPTRKKMQEWADWAKQWIRAVEDRQAEYDDRRGKNLAKIRAMDGIKETVKDCEFEVTRNGIIATAHVMNDGYVDRDYRVDSRMVSSIFSDLEGVE